MPLSSSMRLWPLIVGLVALATLVVFWPASSPRGKPAGVSPAPSPAPRATSAQRPLGSPRSAVGLNLEASKNIEADPRPPAEAKAAIVRTGIDEIQELKQMNTAKFDEAAKRWGQTPRVKELIERWKGLEESWKTQDEPAQAKVVPEMRAMWREAVDLLRAEVEK